MNRMYIFINTANINIFKALHTYRLIVALMHLGSMTLLYICIVIEHITYTSRRIHVSVLYYYPMMKFIHCTQVCCSHYTICDHI